MNLYSVRILVYQLALELTRDARAVESSQELNSRITDRLMVTYEEDFPHQKKQEKISRKEQKKKKTR